MKGLFLIKSSNESTFKLCAILLTLSRLYTVCLYQRGLRNRALTGLFYDFWGPQRLLCVPKIGRKLLLGKKLTPMVIKTSNANGQQKEQIQDLGILASYTGCSMGFLASIIYSSLPGCYKKNLNEEFRNME